MEKLCENCNNTNNELSNSTSDSNGMFGNIGSKIKAFAEVITWIGIIGSVISGISMISIDEDLIVGGLLIMTLGSILSWVSSFVLYGFGQLINSSEEIVCLLSGGTPKKQQRIVLYNEASSNAESETKIGKCQNCDTNNTEVKKYIITDNMGTRYRYLCEICANNLKK